MPFVSRAGQKLDFALKHFGLNVSGQVAADLGCSTGGFTDCLLLHGAARVYAVDTGYGVLDWKLRCDARVVVYERTNALHLTLPQPVNFISIDVGWTPQKLILPPAASLLSPGGHIVSLLKPHYESKRAHLSSLQAQQVAATVCDEISALGFKILGRVKSPLAGEKAKNDEYLLWISPPGHPHYL